MSTQAHNQRGVTLLELLISLTISALLFAGLSQLFISTLNARTLVSEQQDLNQRARFAMERMVAAVQGTARLILPLGDRSATDLVENIREETVPASPAPTGSSKATAVLAVALPATVDINLDGIADGDNDGDGLIDEDWGGDNTNDGANGLLDVDDNGDGRVDETSFFGGGDEDDDEYLGFANEDPVNGIDDDGDGSIDEDADADMNGDNAPGVAGVDDDGDGSIDEGSDDDDDEDGADNEDWLDTLAFYLDGSNLMERATVPFDTDGDNDVDGRDRQARVIATNVTRLRFERLSGSDSTLLVDIGLSLSDGDNTVSLTTRARVGAIN